MKTLIVGGNSSLSKALVPILKEEGEVITAGRSNCDLFMDLSSSQTPFRIPADVDVIVHTAADFGGSSPEAIVKAETVNVLGTLRLCQASVESGVKHFVFISSIYSQLRSTMAQYSIYALSKKHAEEAASFFCERQRLPLTILKPSQLYGPTKAFEKHQPFLYTIIDKASKGEAIDFFGRHDALRNFLFIDDLVQIILRVIRQQVTGAYACQHPRDVSFSEIANAAISVFKSKSEISFLTDKDDVQDNVFPIEDILYKRIGFAPKISIAEGIRTIANHRN